MKGLMLRTEVAVSDLAVRAAVPADRASVIAMHDHCSTDSIRRRWHGPRRDLPEPYLTEVLAGLPTHIALVALNGRRVVALASAVEQDRRQWELGVLVDDAWQRRGVATNLLGVLAQRVAARGGRRLNATALPEQAALLPHLEQLGPVTLTTDADSVTAHVDLRAGGGARQGQLRHEAPPGMGARRYCSCRVTVSGANLWTSSR
jgi:GNAT superfamily N-acetyltransferase